jgi:hypothetical protein
MSAWEMNAKREGPLVRIEVVLRSPQGDVRFIDVPLVDPTRTREAVTAARTVSKATAGAISFGAVMREVRQAGAA